MDKLRYLLLILSLCTFLGLKAQWSYSTINLEVLEPPRSQDSGYLVKTNTVIIAKYNPKIKYDSLFYSLFLTSLYENLMLSPIWGETSVDAILFSQTDIDSLNSLPAFAEAAESFDVSQILLVDSIYMGTKKTQLCLKYQLYNKNEEKLTRHFIEHIADLNEENDYTIEVHHEMAEVLAEYVLPYWRQTARPYFDTGNSDLREAKDMVKKNNWQSAVTLWKSNAVSADNTIAAKSSFNLALAAEMSNDLALALDWLNFSKKIKSISYTENYLNAIQKRQQKQELLEKMYPVKRDE